MPQSGFGGQYFHADVCAMAAAYAFHLVQNHPFVDGNKRIGAATASVFLWLNGIELKCTSDELADLILDVARGQRSKDDIARFFRAHSRKKRKKTGN